MNNDTIFGRSSQSVLIIWLLITLLSITWLRAQKSIQSYPKGKITMNNGFVIVGENLEITPKDASFLVNGSRQSIELTIIKQILVKKGRAKTCAVTSGLTCFGSSLFLVLAVAEEKGGDDYISTAIMGGIFYVAGYIVGNFIIDPWKIVYENGRWDI